ncbi:MAG: glycosyltransferase [Patescibacteria group bacterium]|nr:glycosyltransferase [Patescibacteria group bacterium]
MKVLIVTDFFYPHWTGVSKSIFNATQALSAEFDFTVLTVRYKKDLSSTENLNGVKVIRTNPLFSFSRAKYSLALVFQAISLIKNNQTVVINSPCTNVLLIAILTKLFNKKLLVFHQGDLILPQGFVNRLIEKVFDFCTRLSCTLADKVSTYTNDYAQHSRVLKSFLAKLEPIIWPLPEFKKSNLTKQHILKTKVSVQMQKIKKNKVTVFGFAGRFVEEKGFDVLFKAIAQPELSQKNYHFVFAGETDVGYEQTFTKNLPRINEIKNRVTFLGLLSGDELLSFYQSIDCFILCSRSECFALVQPESMVQKKPVIAPDIPGARQVVKQTKFGWLFKSQDEKNLAKTIIKAAENLSSVQSNYCLVKKMFNYEKLSQKAEDFIKN